MFRLATTQLRATRLTMAGPSVARTFTVSARRLRSDDAAPSSSRPTVAETEATARPTNSSKDFPKPKSNSSSPSTTDDKPKKPALTVAEQDALMFATLDGREGAGAGNEIKDGAWESGMTKFTRRNQYRVI